MKAENFKELRGIKLINWHYFQNETIKLKGATLLTGDNGSGKSTILDAIQYVLVADQRKVRFNSSAGEEHSKRDLLGYVRCKTGADGALGKRVLRTGDVTSVICLEFFDHKKKEPFLVGVVIDAYSDDTLKEQFFIINNASINDDYFIVDQRPRNITEFRAKMGALKNAELLAKDAYKHQLRTKLGHIHEKFFSLFVKAISFKSIKDIREFVYEYLLEPREIDLRNLLENLEQYDRFLVLAEETERKLHDLEVILEKHKQLKKDITTRNLHRYLVLRGNLADLQERYQSLTGRIEELAGEKAKLEEKLNILTKRLLEVREEKDNVNKALWENSAYRRLTEIEKEIKELQAEQKRLKTLQEKVQTFLQNEAALYEKYGFSQAEILKEMVLNLRLKDVKALLPELINFRKNLKEQTAQELYRIEAEISTKKALKQEIEEILDGLKQNKHTYPPEVGALINLLKEKFREEAKKEVEPKILAELLEVKDERWQNAVEGYLNTQRFDIILPPEDFDRALAIYERYKKERRISRVGIVNTGRVKKYLGQIEKNSLAEEVTSENPYALAYAQFLMGRVIKCEHEGQLKLYPRSITPTCMVYQNHTARQIDFKVYEIPYIGSRAIKKQIEKREQELRELEQELDKLYREKFKLTERQEELSGARDEKDREYALLEDRLMELLKLAEIEEKIVKLSRERESIDTSGIKALEESHAKLVVEEKALEAEKDKVQGRVGMVTKELEFRAGEEKQLKIELESARREYDEFCSQNPDLVGDGEKRFEEELKGKSPGQIAQNFSSSLKGLETRINNLRADLTELRSKFNQKYAFGGSITGDDITDFLDLYRKLAESELPDYKERMERAKAQAEEEFKSHFVHKLKESIEEAKGVFRELNAALRGIKFGEDEYRFRYENAPEYKKYMELIDEVDKLTPGETSLFSGVLREKFKEVMDEMFEGFLHRDKEAGEFLNRLTDYRNYLTYDIEILHGDGTISHYSKVYGLKSGGETQTPFYVAIVASFVQLYRIHRGDSTIRLMLFDEAFNRMDADRVESSIRFMKFYGLQPIIAVPSDKLALIAPHVETNLLVLRAGDQSFVEEFYYDGSKEGIRLGSASG
ncbi:ATP-binding protein [Carboxydothermus ferrireducens]|uniref:Uncharacterized protein YPO0396 n=1 Tax=Carboxydothermus ferrireducens DSM 11255 TaxID=1119529 RepID=A0ABX2RCU6_9THEO|nr:SbcC/MukB-like Walker B domain-containing protein [Carboxydothermus ferrireducens]NYE58417.1 uncharacterized protein YPO0396 [Carboxydothermus ferrireducens DSM 11255]